MSCEMRAFLNPRSVSAARMSGSAMPWRRRSSTRVREGASPEVGAGSLAAAGLRRTVAALVRLAPEVGAGSSAAAGDA
eukprot:11144401-Heterocapsa_arctica.AAC.1